MKCTVIEKTAEVWLEKPFDQPPDGFSLGVEPLPETRVETLSCGIWEEKEVDLEYNSRSEEHIRENGEFPCKHFVLTMDMTVHNTPGALQKTYRRLFGYYPRVIVAFNEGHCCSTGVCLDCLLENLGGIK